MIKDAHRLSLVIGDPLSAQMCFFPWVAATNERMTKTQRQAWSVRLICRHSGYISNSTPWPSISMTWRLPSRHRGTRRRLDVSTCPPLASKSDSPCAAMKGHKGHTTPPRHARHLWSPPDSPLHSLHSLTGYLRWKNEEHHNSVSQSLQLDFTKWPAVVFFSMFETSWALVAPPLRH